MLKIISKSYGPRSYGPRTVLEALGRTFFPVCLYWLSHYIPKSSFLFLIAYLGGAESPFIDRTPSPHNAGAPARAGWRRQRGESTIFLPTSIPSSLLSRYVWRKISEPKDHKFVGPCTPVLTMGLQTRAKKIPLIEIPAFFAAWHIDQPMHGQYANLKV